MSLRHIVYKLWLLVEHWKLLAAGKPTPAKWVTLVSDVHMLLDTVAVDAHRWSQRVLVPVPVLHVCHCQVDEADNTSMISSSVSSANSFTIFTNSRCLVVAATSPEEKSKWIRDLQVAISAAASSSDNTSVNPRVLYPSLKSNSVLLHYLYLFTAFYKNVSIYHDAASNECSWQHSFHSNWSIWLWLSLLSLSFCQSYFVYFFG